VLSARVDCSAGTYLPVCTACSWRGLPRPSRLAAVLVAERHAIDVHRDETAGRAAAKRRQRERTRS
jgi:hypothetical protein